MESGRHETVVFRILRNENGCWDVRESDVENVIASFDDRQDACDYANDLSMTKDGSTVLLLDESNPSSERNRDMPQG